MTAPARPPHLIAVSVLTAAAAAALLLGACGGGSSGASGQRAGTTSADSPPPYTPHSREEARAYHAASALYSALGASGGSRGIAQRASAACAAMSPEMRRHIAFAARASAGGQGPRRCKAAVAYLLTHSQSGGKPLAEGTRVVGLKLNGGSAVASVRTTSGRTSRLRLVKEGGQWRVAGPAG